VDEMGKLNGKVAIITGGSVGIGRGIAIAMAKEGGDLCICARTIEKLNKAADELRALGVKVLVHQCDIMEYEELKKLVEATIDEFGRIDILVNNACTIPWKRPFEEITPEIWKQPIKSGLEATFYLMQLCYPHLKKRGGKIINVSSAAGSKGIPGSAPYAAAKAGIEALTRVGALEWAKDKINVNCISPFAMSEQFQVYLDSLPEEQRKNPAAALGVSMPKIGYLGDPVKHVGPATVFLATSDSDYITGHILPVDGGHIEIGV
jgi:NAD(P)-dependent dehydrogenase (short-subunit alcohol dehydrogenase family)